MIKLLKYDTVLKPFYIALSDDLRFHVLYGDTSVVTSNSIGGAINAIPNKHLYGLTKNLMDWERLPPEQDEWNLIWLRKFWQPLFARY